MLPVLMLELLNYTKKTNSPLIDESKLAKNWTLRKFNLLDDCVDQPVKYDGFYRVADSAQWYKIKWGIPTTTGKMPASILGKLKYGRV